MPIFRLWSRLTLALAVLAAGVAAARAQDGSRPSVSVSPQSGYARVLFEWPEEARASASLTSDVIVVRFPRSTQIDADTIARRLEGVVALVRLDADGRALRIALKTPARIATSQSGRRFALDIVSPQKKSDPPPVTDPEAAKSRGPFAVELRTSELETMTRLTFDWPERAPYDAALRDGQLTIRFQKPGTIDLARINSKPPAWVKSVSSQATPAGLTIIVAVDPEIRLSDRAEGNRVVFDLIEPAQDRAVAAAAAPPSAPTSAGVVADAGPVDPHLATPVPPAPIQIPPPPAKGPGAPTQLVKTDAAAAAAAQTPAAPATDASHTADLRPAAVPAPLDAQDLSAAPAAAPPLALKPGLVTVEARDATVFAAATFTALPRAAIFRRGPAVWLVFETREPLDASALMKTSAMGVALWSAPQPLSAGVLGMRLRVAESTPVSVSVSGQAWVLTIGPGAAPEAGGITFLREVQPGGPAGLKALVQDSGTTVWVKDPALGDRIAVTPAGAPLRGVAAGRRMAELDVLPSLHGLAVRAIADDLQIASARDAVTLTRPRGLAMSGDAQRAEDFAGPVPDSEYPAADLVAWKTLGDDPITAARTLLRSSADSPGGMSQQRMSLARYYVANDLGAEALGVIKLIAAQDQTSESTPALRTLRAIANLQLRRYQSAVDDLSIGALARDPHAAFWRGIAFAGLGKATEASANLNAAAKFFGAYPPAWQARARLALADASLSLGDARAAEQALGALPPGLPKALDSEFKYMRGRVAEAQSRDDAALSLYAEAMAAGHPEIAVKSELQALTLKSRTKKLTPEQAIDQLERLRYKWRGDQIELATLHALGQALGAAGRVREGLEAMSAAVRNFPNAEKTRDLKLDMQRMFASVFQSGTPAGMTPVQALALFYDYKDLTPPGLEGDEIIRKLSERLAEVDLLPQAAELLQHQVDNRLDGVARAQVATRLAVIYLLDRKPEKALAAIRSSRQVRLPDAMISERRLLEARALADLKLTDEAIETLADDDSAAAGRLRGDVFWAGQRWAEAGKVSETLAGEQWASATPLSDTTRQDVLRAGVAYVLANDRAGVERLRVRFGPKMADSPHAKSFAVVVGETNPASPDMRAMVRQVAAVDSLDAFLKDLKGRKDPAIN
jgi:tetratricopeptide (TPR) repeat protein